MDTTCLDAKKPTSRSNIITNSLKTVKVERKTTFFCGFLRKEWASLMAQLVKNLPAIQETPFHSWVGKIR